MTAKRWPTEREVLEEMGYCTWEIREFVSDNVRKILAGHKQSRAKLSRGLIACLDRCNRWDIAPPKELIGAIAQQLKITGQPRSSARDKAKRDQAIRLLAENPSLSNRKLARACGVSLPTIAQWKRPPRIDEDEMTAQEKFLAKRFGHSVRLSRESLFMQEVQFEAKFSPETRQRLKEMGRCMTEALLEAFGVEDQQS